MVWQEMQIIQIHCAYTGFYYKILCYNSEYCYLKKNIKKKTEKNSISLSFLTSAENTFSDPSTPKKKK